MTQAVSKRSQKTRERILDTASRLFYQQGIRAVGVDMIVEEAGIAKMTLYNHFRSKDELVAAYMEGQKEYWLNWTRQAATGNTPTEKILALFDNVELLLKSPDFRGCPFLNGCAEFPDTTHPVREIMVSYSGEIHRFFQELARDTGCENYESLGSTLLYLIEGALVFGNLMGQTSPIVNAREIASELLKPYT